MSNAGTFTLISNDGKQDQIITATKLLSQRIQSITAAKVQQGAADTNPTLSDIERSHVLFVHAHFKPYVALALEYYKVAANNVTLGTDVKFSLPQYGDFFADMVVHVQIDSPTASFTGTAANAADCALYRYCDWIGERIFQKVQFEVNSNPLDDYMNDVYVMHRQFRVSPGQMTGWMRNMGQQEASEGTYIVPQAAATVAPVSARAKINVFDGIQEYKQVQPVVDLFVPLLFWFNTDPRLAFPSVAVPYGQRFINITLAQKSDLIRAIINPAATTTTLSAPVVTTPSIKLFDLYINNLFVMPDIHNIFISRIAFTLIRVHRRQTQQVNKSSDSVHLVQLKWPTEVMYLGFRPTANITSNATVAAFVSQSAVVDPNMEDWHRFSLVTNTLGRASSTVSGAVAAYNYKQESNHITTLNLSAHGVNLFNNLPAQFFNSYIPYQYGGELINTPKDKGLFMISFSLYPGSYQPSGHFNVSRAREFYLDYTSTYVDSNSTADLIVNVQAINFLLISDGSATLRYTT